MAGGMCKNSTYLIVLKHLSDTYEYNVHRFYIYLGWDIIKIAKRKLGGKVDIYTMIIGNFVGNRISPKVWSLLKGMQAFCLYKNKGSKTPKAAIFYFLDLKNKKNVLKMVIMILLQTCLMF